MIRRTPLYFPADPDTAAGGGGNDDKPPVFDPSRYVSAEDFGKTAAKLRGIDKTISELSGKALTRDGLFDVLAEAGLVEKTEDGKFKPRVATPPPSDGKTLPPDPRLAQMEQELERYKQREAQRDLELQQEKERSRKQTVNVAVRDALTKANALRPDRDAVHLETLVQQAEDGSFYVKGTDRYKQEIQIPLEEYATAWLEQNPELKKATTAGGSGAPAKPGSGDGGNGAGPKRIPKEQYSDMAWYAKNADKFRSGEYVFGE